MSDELKRIEDLEVVCKNLLEIAKTYIEVCGPCDHNADVCICDLKEQVEVAEEVLRGEYYHAWGTEKGDEYRCDRCGTKYIAHVWNYKCPKCGVSHPARLQHEG